MSPPLIHHDAFHFLVEINKASLVALVEGGVIEPGLGRRIADVLTKVVVAQGRSGAARSPDYLAFERALVAAGGVEVTRLHSGRSRQDIFATIERLALCEAALIVSAGLNDARRTLLALAERYAHDIIPAYTWGVQAQPTTFGHMLLAHGAALTRASERLRQAYARLNLSPLGSAALATSSFPLDRKRLGELLGFDGVLVNSFDAVQLSPIDAMADLASVTLSIALAIGGFVAECSSQYAQIRPWIVIPEGEHTGVSSLMPQKRNPRSLIMLRVDAGILIGLAQTVVLLAHNVQPGVSDYKGFIIDPRDGGPPMQLLLRLEALLGKYASLLGILTLDRERARLEVEADYSTATGLADCLQRDHGVPFRAGHEIASEMVDFGRKHHLGPGQISYDAVGTIFRDVATRYGLDPTIFPMSESEFRKALSAENMIMSSRGMGGPQPDEVTRMIAAALSDIDEDSVWLSNAAKRRRTGETTLHGLFEGLRISGG